MRFKISISIGLLISTLSFVLAIAILMFQTDYESFAALSGNGNSFSIAMSPPTLAIVVTLLIISVVGLFIKPKRFTK